jgi:hypothetical protein
MTPREFSPTEELLLKALQDLLPFLEDELQSRERGGEEPYITEAQDALNLVNAAIAAVTCTECGRPVDATSLTLSNCPECAAVGAGECGK